MIIVKRKDIWSVKMYYTDCPYCEEIVVINYSDRDQPQKCDDCGKEFLIESLDEDKTQA